MLDLVPCDSVDIIERGEPVGLHPDIACALAFWISAAERVVLLGTKPADIHSPSLYVTRLIAFLLIIGAIWDKNRSRRP